ncbi:MAG TPA: NUDIX hydrolase [Candidatus Synoicihabitans sp.]|nr:NUDIX hydrolase [Candidatus Synoicihabitans sp.]
MLQPWRRLDSRVLVQDRWCTLRADRFQRADGRVIEPFYVLDDPDWVHVVAVRDDGRIVVVRQFRPAAGVFCVELPGGCVDRGEDPLAAAQRELREEAGCTAASWRLLHVMHPNPARQTNRFHLYFATGVVELDAPALDENEEIEHSFLTVDEILHEIHHGSFTQGLHIGAFLLALPLLQPPPH